MMFKTEEGFVFLTTAIIVFGSISSSSSGMSTSRNFSVSLLEKRGILKVSVTDGADGNREVSYPANAVSAPAHAFA